MSENKTFRVSVNATTAKQLSVSSATIQNSIAATGDVAAYFAHISEKWAHGDGLIENTDYSAKTYAQQAKEAAENAGIFNDGSEQIYQTMLDKAEEINTTITTLQQDAITNITESKEQAVIDIVETQNISTSNIETARINAVSEIDTHKNDAVDAINETVATVTAEIESVNTVAQNIEDVAAIADNLDDILNKTVNVGQTYTGDPGTMASVENVGTQFAPVLDFTIPKGETGNDGGMGAEYNNGTLSFFSESGSVLYSRWGNIQGDITSQADLQAEFEKRLKGVIMTQVEYDALDVKEAKTLYLIEEV